MMKLQLFFLCKKATVIYLNRAISTNVVLLTRQRKVEVPPKIPYEPGIRRRQDVFQKDSDVTEDVEHEEDIDNEIDIMNIDKAYDMDKYEKARRKQKLQQIITAKKFFSPRRQPTMLTCNERHCIRHLHKEDPVNWDLKTLSESFPATTDTIKKILKSKWKITPERAKLIDSRVQKNWELLAEGKLDADPHVLEHLKKFINRRQVLLEQLKNEDAYLPEVKNEPVWNNGEFSNVLVKYEKAVKKLVRETEKGKLLEDGMSKAGNEVEEEKSSLDVVHEKVREAVSRHKLENKDSFLFGGLTNFYSKETTLEELEEQILKQADKKPLGLLDKAVLENKLGVKIERNSVNLTETESSTSEKTQPNSVVKAQQAKHIADTDMRSESIRVKKRISNKTQMETDEMLNESSCSLPDARTKFAQESGVGKLLEELYKKHEPEESKTSTKDTPKDKDKPKIDFSDPERLRRENIYYNEEVNDIKNTSFWNSHRSSKEKALAESEKRPHDGPRVRDSTIAQIQTSILSADPYPQRIKIPRNRRGSGLTFKVKDCFYDDDGEFLYRVPGMINK